MKSKLFIFFLFNFLIFIESISLKANTYRVFFKDKGNVTISTYDSLIKLSNPKTLIRRAKVNKDSLLKFEHIPICKEYIDSILKYNVKIIHKLNWLNYILINSDSTIINDLNKFNFIKKIIPSASKMIPLNLESLNLTYSDYLFNCGVFIPNNTSNQLDILNIPYLHRKGINGIGIDIGVMDSGFKTKINNALLGMNISDEYDFINNDSITQNELNENSNQDGHGSAVLSIIGGYSNGNFIGVAPSSNYHLAKTESIDYELKIEEDNFAKAIEYLEEKGIEVINSSLGYRYFDSTQENYNLSDFDNQSSLTTIYVNKAVNNGICFVTASGNFGPNENTLIAPADAKNAISVGSSNYNGIISNFSSHGIVDSIIKPDFVAVGEAVSFANKEIEDQYLTGNGTSYATPQISGSIALLLNLYPQKNPYEIKNMISNFCNFRNNKQPIFGFGIPNFKSLVDSSEFSISPVNVFKVFNKIRIGFYKFGLGSKNLNLIYKLSNNSNYSSKPFEYATVDNFVYTDIENDFSSEYISFKIQDNDSSFYRPFYYEFYNFNINNNNIQCGIDELNLPMDTINTSVSKSNITKRINMFANKNELKIYNNPSQIFNINIYDLLGNIIYSKQFLETDLINNTIDLPQNLYSNQIYFISYTDSYISNTIKYFK